MGGGLKGEVKGYKNEDQTPGKHHVQPSTSNGEQAVSVSSFGFNRLNRDKSALSFFVFDCVLPAIETLASERFAH